MSSYSTSSWGGAKGAHASKKPAHFQPEGYLLQEHRARIAYILAALFLLANLIQLFSPHTLAPYALLSGGNVITHEFKPPGVPGWTQGERLKVSFSVPVSVCARAWGGN